jgi:MULE transposase domain
LEDIAYNWRTLHTMIHLNMQLDQSNDLKLLEREVASLDIFELCADEFDPDELQEKHCDQNQAFHADGIGDAIDITFDSLPHVLKSRIWPDRTEALMDAADLYARFGYQLSTFSSESDRLRLKCHSSGSSESRVVGEDRVRNSSSARCECEFHIAFSKPDSLHGAWRLAQSNAHVFTHSCAPNPLLISGGITTVRQLTGDMIAMLTDACAAKRKIAEVCYEFMQKFNVHYIEPHILQTAFNRIRSAELKGASQTEELMQYLTTNTAAILHSCEWETMKSTDRDEHGSKQIKNLFIMTNQMRSMFDQYGQFIVVDATYKTNEFGRPLLMFTVRSGTGTFFIVGIALIKSESFINLSWAFNQLKHFLLAFLLGVE